MIQIGGERMDLTTSIKKAAQQQPAGNKQNTGYVKKGVDLGAGRISRYGYNGSGRPTNESYENIESDGQILNE
jgi:hypothetical protein